MVASVPGLPIYPDHPAHLAALRAAALRAADPAAAVRRVLTAADLADVARVFVVGAGKAGVAMAQAAAEITGDKLTAGVVVVPQVPALAPPRITFVQGGHPVPTEGSLAGGQAIAEVLAQTAPRDLVIALISGGGSALLELLRPGLTLADLQATNTALLQCGATIHEFNTIRKRLSQIKGGGLLRLAAPARVLGLILSDVVGNPLDIIASGPTVESPGDAGRALEIVRRYHLSEVLPPPVMETLGAEQDEARAVRERPPRVDNRLIASNRLAGEAAAQAARGLGFDAQYVADDWQGEAREMGRQFAELLVSTATRRRATSASGGTALAMIVGGEATVTVRGQGKGGRNQEAALAAALAIAGRPGIVISTFGTDGVDGPTDAAGATVGGDTIARARALGLDPQAYLDDNDAYTFFAALGDLVLTGPTGTNVNDLTFGLVYDRAEGC